MPFGLHFPAQIKILIVPLQDGISICVKFLIILYLQMRSWRYCSPFHLMTEQNASLKDGKEGWLSSIRLEHFSLYILGEMDSENRPEFSNTPTRLAETSGKIPLRLKTCDVQQRQQIYVFIVSWLQWRSRIASHPQILNWSLLIPGIICRDMGEQNTRNLWARRKYNVSYLIYITYKFKGVRKKKQSKHLK